MSVRTMCNPSQMCIAKFYQDYAGPLVNDILLQIERFTEQSIDRYFSHP